MYLILKDFFKVDFEKKSADDKNSMQNFAGGKESSKKKEHVAFIMVRQNDILGINSYQTSLMMHCFIKINYKNLKLI